MAVLAGERDELGSSFPPADKPRVLDDGHG
jgi:hypothetical protein